MVSRTMNRFDLHHKHPAACLHAVGPDASSTRTLLLSLSTIAGTTISNPPWVNFQSAGWVSFQSAPTELCKPCGFLAMPSIEYRLARVAAGDGVCGVSLYPVSAHDIVAGHALLRGAGGVLLNEQGRTITYVTEANMQTVSRRCFGGSLSACRTLVVREWDRIFTGASI
jgi:myo-inositol-1(or 4)-monophosphatase